MTPTNKTTTAAASTVTDTSGKSTDMSRESTALDQAEKGYLTDAECLAKNMDVEGKGCLSSESQLISLKEDNRQIKKQLYGLAILCVLLFIGTIAGTVMAVKNSKDTIVDMKTGVMKVNDGNNNEVTVKSRGATFQTTGSIAMNEETTTADPSTGEITTDMKLVTRHCVSGEDLLQMWSANEQGIDARLLILHEGSDDGTNDTDTEISTIKHVTSGDATWKKTNVVMGGMSFFPSDECADVVLRRRRLKLLLEGNNNNLDGGNDIPAVDNISIHRKTARTKQPNHPVNLLEGNNNNNNLDGGNDIPAVEDTISIHRKTARTKQPNHPVAYYF